MKEKIRNLLAEYLGVESTDIEDDDSLVDDLHMGPTQISDFLQSLDASEFAIEDIDLSSLETFSDLAEAISSHIE